jgi:uncharacterized membrane protein YhaH (DUF805 family)
MAYWATKTDRAPSPAARIRTTDRLSEADPVNTQGRNKMTFVESISTCFNKYATFEGRAPRSEYWWFVLFTWLVSLATGMINETLSGLFSLAVLLPSLAVGARRLHDIDKSGWFLLLWLIPIIGWLVLLYWFVQEGREPNRF